MSYCILPRKNYFYTMFECVSYIPYRTVPEYAVLYNNTVVIMLN